MSHSLRLFVSRRSGMRVLCCCVAQSHLRCRPPLLSALSNSSNSTNSSSNTNNRSNINCNNNSSTSNK